VRGWLAAATSVLALAGCVSVPHASPERDAEAKRFITHPAAATLYVYRPDAASYRMDESVLFVDHRLIGAILAGAFFRIELRPGRHLLYAGAPDLGRIELDLRRDEITFVSLTLGAGHSYFERVAPDLARREIARCCVLLENWAPGQRPLLR
jgi:hypothetical protein